MSGLVGPYKPVALDLAVQPDGKLVVVGAEGSTGNIIVARFDPDGSLDDTFGVGQSGLPGYSIVPEGIVGETTQATGIALLPTGQIVVAGTGCAGLFLARLDDNGILDADFGTQGIVFDRAVPLNGSGLTYVAVQTDGRIVVAGTASGEQNANVVVVARYNVDGSRDASFGDGGVFTYVPDAYANATGLTLRPDGRILIAASQDNVPTLISLTADGKLDTTFGGADDDVVDGAGSDGTLTGGAVLFGDGVATSGFGLAYGALGFQPVMGLAGDESIILAGGRAGELGENWDEPGFDQFAISRHDADGDLDGNFGSGGVVFSPLTGIGLAIDMVVLTDGSFVVAGLNPYWTTGRGGDIVLGLFKPTGDLDTSFGDGGFVSVDSGLVSDAPYGLAEHDGRLFVTGRFGDNDFSVLAFDLAGNLDPSFGEGGVSGLVGPYDPQAIDLVVQPDGKLIVVG